MPKFLDEAGLSYFWSKIKEKINSEIQVSGGSYYYVEGDTLYITNNGGSGGLTEDRVNELIDAKIAAAIDSEY